jgi:hypothetical protein
VNRPDLLAFFRFAITGDAGFLAVFATVDSDGRQGSHLTQGLAPERCAELVRSALGVPADFPVEIENVQPWSATADTASAFRTGPVFLAGDAAHVMPPTGGFGGNTGVGDVHNLAWKLAMVVKGEAGPELLDSYDAERRPLCRLIVEQAYRRYVDRVDPSLPTDNLSPPLDDASIELGTICRSSAILGEAEAPGSGDLLEDPRHPSGRPGTRIAHVELHRDRTILSTHDLAGTGFALLAGRSGQAWIEAARALSAEGLNLNSHRVAPDGDLADPEVEFEQKVGIDPEGALLLRPDGVIAWRARGNQADPRDTLESVMRRLTFREISAATQRT